MYFPHISSEWDLPSLSPDAGTVSPSVSAFYYDTFHDPLFQTLFVIGFIGFYLLEIVGCHIHSHYVPPVQRVKIQKEQFAGNVTSMFHSLMISISAIAVSVSYRTPMDAFNASPSDPVIVVYKWCIVFSFAYFIVDALLIFMYYDQSTIKTVSFLIHHLGMASGIASILTTHPFLAYVSAMWLIGELSTVCLNLRIFARVWGLQWMYMVSGFGVIVSYPTLRLLWMPYVTWSIWDKGYLDHFR